jgi:hypothetical protein
MDRLVGWCRKDSRRGLTRTPIDRHPCLSPDLSAARERLAVRFASLMHVKQEGPDILSPYCPVQASGLSKPSVQGLPRRAGMEIGQEMVSRVVVGGVDTHKDLHVAAVVDERDQVLGTQSFATTRQG